MKVTLKYYRENGKCIELNQDSELASCSIAQKVARCHDVLRNMSVTQWVTSSSTEKINQCTIAIHL